MSKRTADEWRELFALQQTSGLKIADFCKQHNIAYSTFHKYRRRLESSELGDNKDKAFIPVTINDSPLSQPVKNVDTSTHIILTANNVQLQLNAQCDVDWLANLIKVLNQ